jgi:excisionase family DNA binding protein
MSSPVLNPPRLLTITEAAETLKVSTKTVRRLIETQGLPAVRLGGHNASIRIAVDELEAWLFQDPAATPSVPPAVPVARNAPEPRAVEAFAQTGLEDRG